MMEGRYTCVFALTLVNALGAAAQAPAAAPQSSPASDSKVLSPPPRGPPPSSAVAITASPYPGPPAHAPPPAFELLALAPVPAPGPGLEAFPVLPVDPYAEVQMPVNGTFLSPAQVPPRPTTELAATVVATLSTRSLQAAVFADLLRDNPVADDVVPLRVTLAFPALAYKAFLLEFHTAVIYAAIPDVVNITSVNPIAAASGGELGTAWRKTRPRWLTA